MEQLLGLVGHWVPCGVDLVWVMGATGKGITPKNKKQWHQLGAACNGTGCRRERCGCFLEKLRTQRCHPAGEGDELIHLLLSVHLFLSINIEKKNTLWVFSFPAATGCGWGDA